MFQKVDKIAFVGCGAMGGAMIAGMLSNNLIDKSKIVASDPNKDVRTNLANKYKIYVTDNNIGACAGASIVILSVKPQVLDNVINDLYGVIDSESLVISVVAGVKLARIINGLGHQSVVRCMPNTPSQIGEGITVWIGASSVSELHYDQTRLLLSSLGEQLKVEEEKYLDMATALSGSGPAYVFFFMESLVEAGINLGFTREVSEQLVYSTLKGSIEFADHSARNLSDLRQQVTSPGGTTEAALMIMENSGFEQIIVESVVAAFNRSLSLGGDDSCD